MKNKILLAGFFVMSALTYAQYGYWQQRVEYTMDINFDHIKHQYIGKQKIVYYNNSSDTLTKVFFSFIL